MESLILAQNERWRRGLGMQVARDTLSSDRVESGDLVSTSWVTCPEVGDNPEKSGLIPHVDDKTSVLSSKAVMRFRMGPTPISLLVG